MFPKLLKWVRDQWKRYLFYLMLAAIALAFVFLLQPLQHLERQSIDQRYLLRRRLDYPSPDDRIIVVEIDDYSLDKVASRWPWNRRFMAGAIKNLAMGKPAVFGLDLMFLQESLEDPGQDEELVAEVKQAGNVVLAATPFIEDEAIFVRTIESIPRLTEVAMDTAFVACVPDSDNIARNMWIVNRGTTDPSDSISFTALLAHIYLNRDKEEKQDITSWANALPLDEEGIMKINFHHAFSRIPIADVLEWRYKPEDVHGKILLIGTATPISHDLHMAPHGLIPGVDLHAHTLATLLDRTFIRGPSPAGEFILALVCALAAVAALPVLSPWVSLILVISLLAAWYVAAAALVFNDIVLPVVRPAATILGLYVLLLVDRYIRTLKENIQLYKDLADRKRMEHEIEIARRIQQSMYPSEYPTMDGKLLVDARCEPARELGGDYFDFFQMDEKLCIIVADVSGKGLNAALVVSMAKGLLTALIHKEFSPAGILTTLNSIINSELFETTGGKSYITIILGMLDTRDWSLKYAKAGHTPGLLMRSSGELEMMDPSGLPCGMLATEDLPCPFEEYTVSLHPGDLVVWYTDGVVEATNTRNELFGEEALCTQILNTAGMGPGACIQRVMDKIQYFTSGRSQHDDITIVAFGPK